MSGITEVINALPAPTVVSIPEFDALYAQLRAELVADYPGAEDALQSDHEPLAKLLQRLAYEIINERSARNDSAKAVMLPFAKGADLDNLAIFFALTRHVITPADPEAVPPLAEVLESDEAFRERIILTQQSMGSPGSPGNYRARALSAHAQVLDAAATSPAPGEVLISILSREGDGEADEALCDAVYAVMMASPDTRILTDELTVESATIVEYEIEATLYMKDGPENALALEEAEARLQAFIASNHKVGKDIAISGIYNALQVMGVSRVELTSPVATVEIGETEAGYCTGVTLTVEVDDE